MLRRAGLLAALPALLVPAVAGTTTAAAKTRAPVVTKITPKNVFVGETLTIRGHHFRRGINKNTVAFKRHGARVVLVKAEKGTTKMLRVELPKRLEKVLVVRNGTPTPTRLSVRVFSMKFGKRFTSKAKSPIVGPEKPPAPPEPAKVDPNADCDGDHLVNRVDTDDDGDLLSDDDEKKWHLDQCSIDSDEDGVEDGYELQSARDLNDDEYQANPNSYLPYPETRPYPNPLDGTDAGTDHDGDTLTLMDEYRLWKYTKVRTLTPLTYSAGEQYSKESRDGNGHRVPSQPALGYDKQTAFTNWATAKGYITVTLVDLAGTTLADPFTDVPDAFDLNAPVPKVNRDIRDMDRSGGVSGIENTYYDRLPQNGFLDDAERDEDADGLPNQWEASGCMTAGYWKGLYPLETPYYVTYGGTALDNPDSDGDKVLDGADDQDHDDVPNVMECSRRLAMSAAPADPTSFTPNATRAWKGFVNPFNPCLPHPRSRTCKQYVDVTGHIKAWAPFNETEYEKYYAIRSY
jgi:IPT/TIG domain-containing protein